MNLKPVRYIVLLPFYLATLGVTADQDTLDFLYTPELADSQQLLKRLDKYKERSRCSWDEIARRLHVMKPVIMRWRRVIMISDSYRRHLQLFLDEEERF